MIAPLFDCGFSKADVRDYAGRHGLSVVEKPASACLASRIPVGTRVSRAGLDRVERAEISIAELGFRVLRVRNHESVARVEVGQAELLRARKLRSEIEERLLEIGFGEVTLAAY